MKVKSEGIFDILLSDNGIAFETLDVLHRVFRETAVEDNLKKPSRLYRSYLVSEASSVHRNHVLEEMYRYYVISEKSPSLTFKQYLLAVEDAAQI